MINTSRGWSEMSDSFFVAPRRFLEFYSNLYSNSMDSFISIMNGIVLDSSARRVEGLVKRAHAIYRSEGIDMDPETNFRNGLDAYETPEFFRGPKTIGYYDLLGRFVSGFLKSRGQSA